VTPAQPDAGVVGFTIDAAGQIVAAEVHEQVVEIVVDARLRVPDRLTLRVRDDDTKILDAQTFAVGTAVQVTLGAVDADTTGQVFDGQVTTLAPDFDQGQVTLTVLALDRGCLLQRAPKTASYQSMSYGDIARQLASAAGLSAGAISDGLTLPFVQQSNETGWDFLWRLALDVDYEVKVHGSQLSFAPAGGSASGQPATLTLGQELWSFSPRVTGIGQVGSVAVRGWDSAAAQAIAASATPGRTLSTPGVARDSVADALGEGAAVVVDRPVIDQGHATSVAGSVAAQIANAYVEGEGVLEGTPTLTAGARVKIAGVGAAFGGTYAVSGVRHVVRAASGYETQFFVSGCEDRSLLGLAGSAMPLRTGWARRIVVGVVTNNEDPDALGRVRVRYPALDDSLEGWWARIVAPGAGASRGLLTLPKPGDEVLVAFEHENEQHPYVLGSVYSGPAKPGALSTTDGSFSLTSDKQLTVVAADAVSLTGKTMTLSSNDDAKLTTTGSGAVDVAAKGALTLQSDQAVSLKAGTSAELEAGTSLKISSGGAEIDVGPGGQVSIKGVSVSVQASGVLMLSGAQVMLG
jgi:phage protein D